MLNRSFLIIFSFLVMRSVAYAQQSLPIAGNIQKAYATGTRSRDGSPGKAYWQNKGNYVVKVRFNPKDRQLKGTVAIDYTNNSPDTLTRIVFKLYPNLYEKGSLKATVIQAEDLTDGVAIEKISANGQLLDTTKYVIRGTNMFVRGKQLLPGETIHFAITYSYTLNKGSFVRTGQIDSGAFFLAYFFPRIAVYDDIDGWNMYPYTGQVEFYNDYGHFDAEITVPGNYQVWATGDLKNQHNVYQPRFATLIDESGKTDSVLNIVTEADLRSGQITARTAENTWKFEADNVTDFAFGLSNHYVWQATSLIVDPTTKRRVRVDAVYNPEHTTYQPVISFARKTVEAMSYNFPKIPFPYAHQTVFDGPDEMEFPMLVDNNPFEKKKDAIQLTAHEIFHTIFPFYVGTNETKYSFMDEGWATFAEFYLHPMIDSSIPVDYNMDDINTMSGSESDVPVMTLTPQLAGGARFMDKDQKPALAYLYLKEMLGDKLFLEAVHFYINNWMGKHPTPYDFFNCMNTASGTNLNWFWKNWFFEKHIPDLGIGKVARRQQLYTVEVNNIGGQAVPVHLTIVFSDGSKQYLNSSILTWSSQRKAKTFSFHTKKRVKRIVLGTTYDADTDKNNNTWNADVLR
jgi:hypothetical protein